MQVEDVKTKQFRETSHKNGMLARHLMPPQHCGCDFSIPSVSSAAPATKKRGRSYEALRLSRTIILANLTIRYFKTQPLSGNQWPGSLVHLQILFKRPTLAIFLKFRKKTFLAHFCESAKSMVPAMKMTVQRPKSSERSVFFSYILTWISAWRHSRGHFFNSSTAESVPGLRCF